MASGRVARTGRAFRSESAVRPSRSIRSRWAERASESRSVCVLGARAVEDSRFFVPGGQAALAAGRKRAACVRSDLVDGALVSLAEVMASPVLVEPQHDD